jgi:Dyp-type peroxidase family
MPKQQFISPVTVDENDIQGDVLIGLQKAAEVFNFFEFTDVHRFGADFATILGDITSLKMTREFETSANGPFEKANIAFSYRGLMKLGLVREGDPLDEAFVAGQPARAELLGDVKNKWLDVFANEQIDGVLLVAVAGDEPATAIVTAQQQSNAFMDALRHSVRRLHHEPGMVRGAKRDDPQRGHEHFGFADGVSQPGVKGLTKPNNPNDPNQGFPGQDLVAPGEFVFGDQYEIEVPPGAPAATATPPLPWMANGSYLVFRRLAQHVSVFNDYATANWNGFATSEDQFKAKLIGRWENGSAVVRTPDHSNAAEGVGAPNVNNDFDFGPDNTAKHATDKDQENCPFAAHIRRMYPRSDSAGDASERARILRAGIPFGSDDGPDQRGLLFVCYQTSIIEQFELIQCAASNPTARPTEVGMIVPAVPGVDDILASVGSSRQETWAQGTLPRAQEFVTATGGEYFFSPSLTTLGQIAAQ